MIILASASPRRNELMRMAGLDFCCIPSDAEEVLPAGIAPAEASEYLSGLKAADIAASHPGDIVIGADTTVVIGGEVLGKPADEREAAAMLAKLSGQTHTVYTGVTILAPGHRESFTSAAQVMFYPLTEEEIRDYVATGEPMDKAGAYGIQGRGAVLVRKIDGDFFTVMGLPVAETVRRLRRLRA